MTLKREIRAFARYYKLSLAETTELFELYMRKPQDYRPVLEFDSNAKTVKGRKRGYMTAVCYLAPADSSGHEVCGSRNPFCTFACLNLSGRGIMRNVQDARIRKTLRYFETPDSFHASLLHDAFRLARSAARHKLIPCIRPNGTSDLPKLAWYVAERFQFLQVYDYTKHVRPYQRVRPNYHLTFSFSGTNRAAALDSIEHGVNVTVVYQIAKGQPLPELWNGIPVIDGDEHDLRFLDSTQPNGKGQIIGLRAKGKPAKSATDSPFIVLSSSTIGAAA